MRLWGRAAESSWCCRRSGPRSAPSTSRGCVGPKGTKRHQKAPKGNYCCCRARRNAQFYSAHGHGTIDFVSTVDSCVDLYGRPRALNVVVYTAVASRGGAGRGAGAAGAVGRLQLRADRVVTQIVVTQRRFSCGRTGRRRGLEEPLDALYFVWVDHKSSGHTIHNCCSEAVRISGSQDCLTT